MVDTIGGERIASLTELRRRAKAIIAEVQAATRQQETRVVLTVHGKPVVVLQEYGAYQKMLELLAETQRQLHVAEMGYRLRQMNGSSVQKTPLQSEDTLGDVSPVEPSADKIHD